MYLSSTLTPPAFTTTSTRYPLSPFYLHYRIQVEGKIFCAHTDRPWGPPSLLYNGYRVFFSGVKRPGCGVNHPPPSSAEVEGRVELYICSLFGPSWPVLGEILPLPLHYLLYHNTNTIISHSATRLQIRPFKSPVNWLCVPQY